MWKLRKSVFQLGHILFLAEIVLYTPLVIFTVILFQGISGWDILYMLPFGIFYALPIMYLLSFLFAFLYKNTFNLLQKKVKNKQMGYILTSFFIIVLFSIGYYLMFIGYYQDQIIPIGGDKDHFSHLSTYKSEIQILAFFVFVSVVMSFLTEKYSQNE